ADLSTHFTSSRLGQAFRPKAKLFVRQQRRKSQGRQAQRYLVTKAKAWVYFSLLHRTHVPPTSRTTPRTIHSTHPTHYDAHLLTRSSRAHPGSFSSFYLCLTSTTNTNQLSKQPPKHSSFVSLACTTGISKFVTEILRERTVAYARDNTNKTTLPAIHDKMDLNFQLAARQVSACAL
ncbi:hypothetical protein CPAR01_02208, partial [Colletotrichum paranaense]